MELSASEIKRINTQKKLAARRALLAQGLPWREQADDAPRVASSAAPPQDGGEVAAAAPSEGAQVEQGDDTRCTACNSLEGWNMLFCDGCPAGWHTYCLNPPLAAVPDGEWYCPCCSVALAPRMAASAARLAITTIEANKPRCSNCGTKDVALKRCSRCQQASYCGADCQNASWRRHKNTCAAPLPLDDLWDKVNAALVGGDWRGVLQCEGRMEELLDDANEDDKMCDSIFFTFAAAHGLGKTSTGSKFHALSIIRLEERRVELLGTIQRFRDQGEALCTIADNLFFLERMQEAARVYERARDVGAAHGHFSTESQARTLNPTP